MRPSLIAVCLLALAGSLSAAPQRHLFLDPSFVRDAQGATLVVNPPKSSEIVIRADKPWEKFMISFYLSVIDDGGKLRMWYICRDADNKGNVAYAESADGVNWTKPDLGVVEHLGSRANNLVTLRNFGGTAFRDDHTANPQERYVYFTAAGSAGGFFRFTSADGYTWKRDAAPLLPFDADSQNVTFWDTRLSKYVSYLRGWNGRKQRVGAGRKVVRIEYDRPDRPLGIAPVFPRDESIPKGSSSSPYVHNELADVLVCDELDPPHTDIYTNAIQPYPVDPSWYVGFPAFYRHDTDSPHPNDGWTEIHFVGSRDGVKWERYAREPYLKRGLAGSESASMLYMGVGLVVRGDEIWQYGTGFRTTHGDKPRRAKEGDGTIFRHVHRIDGFVSLDFAAAGGRAATAPAKVTGPRLLLNLDGGALGELRVGLQDGNGRPIEGFTEADCDIQRGNATGTVVTWKGRELPRELQGRHVSVTFSGRRMKLYSFRFE